MTTMHCWSPKSDVLGMQRSPCISLYLAPSMVDAKADGNIPSVWARVSRGRCLSLIVQGFLPSAYRKGFQYRSNRVVHTAFFPGGVHVRSSFLVLALVGELTSVDERGSDQTTRFAWCAPVSRDKYGERKHAPNSWRVTGGILMMEWNHGGVKERQSRDNPSWYARRMAGDNRA